MKQHSVTTGIFFFLLNLLLFSNLYSDGTQPPGMGTEDSPYLVSSLDHLLWISTTESSWSSHFLQLSDIDASPTASWNVGDHDDDQNTPDEPMGFKSIGEFNSYQDYTEFTGVYDGYNFQISDLYINDTASRYAGFFAYCNGSSIKNLKLADINVTGRTTGAITAYMCNSVIENCEVTGNAYGIAHYTGGIVGENRLSEVRTSINRANVTGADYVGGISGNMGSIYDCANYGSIDGEDYTGGICGVGDVIRSVNYGDVSGDNNIGGICGYSKFVHDSENHGNVTGDERVGGITGSFGSTPPAELDSCRNYGNVVGVKYIGGVLGNSHQGKMLNCSNEGDIYCSTRSYYGGLIGKYGDYFFVKNSFYNYGTVLINTSHSITLGGLNNALYNIWITGNYTFDVNNHYTYDGDYYLVDNLADLMNISAFAYDNLSFKLTDDIEMITVGGFYIPYFKGSINGNGKAINHLHIYQQLQDNIGFIGFADSCSISNLYLDRVYIEGRNDVGAFVGRTSYQGDLNISNCHVYGQIEGNDMVAGILGHAYYGEVNITRSSSNAEISSDGEAAGIACGATRIEQCYTENRVSGGLVCGIGYTSGIICCYNTAVLSGSTVFGLGYQAEYSYSCGTVNGNAYPVSRVSSPTSYGNIENCMSGINADFGNNRTTAEMTYPYDDNTYVGWDFDGIWNHDDTGTINNGYPYLGNYANFSFSDELITAGDQISFTNLSFTDSVAWDFDNDGTIDSYETDPVWNYNSAGVYSVKQVAYFDSYIDTTVKSNSIWVTNISPPDQIDSSVGSLEELLWIRNNRHSWHILECDIDASDTRNWFVGDHDLDPNTPDSALGFPPMSKSSIIVSGYGHAISDLYINQPVKNDVGLYNGDEVYIDSVNFVNVDITGNHNVGGVIGLTGSVQCRGTSVTGQVKGNVNVGGFIGYSPYAATSYSDFSANVSGNVNTGGIAGSAARLCLKQSTFSGSVDGITNSGGFAGCSVNSEITKSLCYGEITDDATSGAFIGFNDGGYVTIADSYWNSNTMSCSRAVSNINDYSETALTTVGMTGPQAVYPESFFENEQYFAFYDNTDGYNHDYYLLVKWMLDDGDGYPCRDTTFNVDVYDTDENTVPKFEKAELKNYPNPFNPETTISYSLPLDSNVAISVYNIKGQKVVDLVNEKLEKGEHSIVWKGKDSNMRNVASGVYFVRMKAGKETKIKKVMLLK